MLPKCAAPIAWTTLAVCFAFASWADSRKEIHAAQGLRPLRHVLEAPLSVPADGPYTLRVSLLSETAPAADMSVACARTISLGHIIIRQDRTPFLPLQGDSTSVDLDLSEGNHTLLVDVDCRPLPGTPADAAVWPTHATVTVTNTAQHTDPIIHQSVDLRTGPAAP